MISTPKFCVPELIRYAQKAPLISFNIRKSYVVENSLMPLSLFNTNISYFEVNLVFFLTCCGKSINALILFNANASNFGVNLVFFLTFLIWWKNLVFNIVTIHYFNFTVFNIVYQCFNFNIFLGANLKNSNFKYSFIQYNIEYSSPLLPFSLYHSLSILFH